MGLLDGVTSKIAEPIIRRIVVNEITRWAGPRGDGLIGAICMNKDIFQLWVDKGAEEGVEYGLEDARGWAAKAPQAYKLLTSTNIKKWLSMNDCQHLVRVIEQTYGGDEWLDWTINRFRVGLWGKK